jgi:hypothetical protein
MAQAVASQEITRKMNFIRVFGHKKTGCTRFNESPTIRFL